MAVSIVAIICSAIVTIFVGSLAVYWDRKKTLYDRKQSAFSSSMFVRRQLHLWRLYCRKTVHAQENIPIIEINDISDNVSIHLDKKISSSVNIILTAFDNSKMDMLIDAEMMHIQGNLDRGKIPVNDEIIRHNYASIGVIIVKTLIAIDKKYFPNLLTKESKKQHQKWQNEFSKHIITNQNVSLWIRSVNFICKFFKAFHQEEQIITKDKNEYIASQSLQHYIRRIMSVLLSDDRRNINDLRNRLNSIRQEFVNSEITSEIPTKYAKNWCETYYEMGVVINSNDFESRPEEEKIQFYKSGVEFCLERLLEIYQDYPVLKPEGFDTWRDEIIIWLEN